MIGGDPVPPQHQHLVGGTVDDQRQPCQVHDAVIQRSLVGASTSAKLSLPTDCRRPFGHQTWCICLAVLLPDLPNVLQHGPARTVANGARAGGEDAGRLDLNSAHGVGAWVVAGIVIRPAVGV